MEELMTFSVTDYERATVRILRIDSPKQPHVIGTGFLVAPRYVMTCAHVVLQALGIRKSDFESHQQCPEQTIWLNFHILAVEQNIEAQIIDWVPYSIEKGDIAGLKLLAPPPTDAKPIPLMDVSLKSVTNDKHSVYGFGASQGGRSDAYRPKTPVADGRWQLCKYDQPNDETIRAGYSGAPLWNERMNGVLGMVATAIAKDDDDKPPDYSLKSTAYAIPTSKLRPTLNRIAAHWLEDVLEQCLQSMVDESDRNQLNASINSALRQCNPDGFDAERLQQLIALSSDRSPLAGWETEGRLVQFVITLALLGETPTETYDRLKQWVEGQSFAFSELIERQVRASKQQQPESLDSCEHLMVAVDPDSSGTNQLRISIWAIATRKTYNPNLPPQPLISEQSCAASELPKLVRKTIRDKLGKKTPTVHLFVSRNLFDRGLETVPISRRGGLGSEYPLVLRTNLTLHPINKYYYDDWREKWETIEREQSGKTGDLLQAVDGSLPDYDLLDSLEKISMARLEKCLSVPDLLDSIAAEGIALPILLWAREPNVQDKLMEVLDCTLEHFPSRLREERESAHRQQCDRQSQQQASQTPTSADSTENEANSGTEWTEAPLLLGNYVSLMWEDPKIVPPDMVFNPDD
jgi:hypothetical protein